MRVTIKTAKTKKKKDMFKSLDYNMDWMEINKKFLSELPIGGKFYKQGEVWVKEGENSYSWTIGNTW